MPLSTEIGRLKDVFPIIWHIETFDAHSSLNAELALPAQRGGELPEVLTFDASGSGNYQYPNYGTLKRVGNSRCNDSDYDLSELKTKGRVRIRTRIVEGLPALEEIFVAALKPPTAATETPRLYFRLAASRALATTCANF